MPRMDPFSDQTYALGVFEKCYAQGLALALTKLDADVVEARARRLSRRMLPFQLLMWNATRLSLSGKT